MVRFALWMSLLVAVLATGGCGGEASNGSEGGAVTTGAPSPPTSTVEGYVYETESQPSVTAYRPPLLFNPAGDQDVLPAWVAEQGWPVLPGLRRGPSAEGFTVWVHPRAEDGFCVIITDDEAQEFTPGCATFGEHTNQGRLEPKAIPARTVDDERTVFAGLMLAQATGVSHPDADLDVTIDDGVFIAFGPRPNMNPVVDYTFTADRAALIEACRELFDSRDGAVTTDDGATVTAADCADGQALEWSKVYTQATWERFGLADTPITVDLTDYGSLTQTLTPTPSTTDQPKPPFLSRIARAEIVEEEVAVFWWFAQGDDGQIWCVHAIDRDEVSATRCITELANGALRVALDDERMVQVVTSYFDMGFFTVEPLGGEGETVVQVANGRRRGAVMIPPGPARVTLYHEDGIAEDSYLTPDGQ